jgi:hypothetical protein
MRPLFHAAAVNGALLQLALPPAAPPSIAPGHARQRRRNGRRRVS